MIDLTQYPVVDDHCHAFLIEKLAGPKGSWMEKQGFETQICLSALPIQGLHLKNTILYRKVVTELGRILACSNEFQQILEKRKEELKSNAQKYISTLLSEAQIDTFIVDTGFPSEEFTGYSVPVKKFQRIVGSNVKSLYRIEPTIYSLFQASLAFKDFLEKYENSLDMAIRKDGHIGFKSIIAYIYGLDIHKTEESTARDVYRNLKRKKALSLPMTKKTAKVIQEEKALRDYLVCLAIEKSIKFGIPFQLHTGFGDSPILDLRKANPANLYEILIDEDLGKAKIVLVHSGYPYVEEAGFLANGYPNVYIDLSEMIPYVTIGMKEKIHALFEMAPTTKIMYGSDAHIPELYWISAIWGRKAVSGALQQLVDSEAIDEDYAYKAGRMILSKNAEKLYKL